ncbi:MAG: glycine cleavage T C-terminal barrel domain-containing protein [Deinococcales bacterium]
MGREVALKQKDKKLKKKLCCLLLEDRAACLLGYEAVMQGETCVGYVTSANFGYSVGSFIAYSYLPYELSQPGYELEILYFGKPFKAVVSEEPLFDAAMIRMK